MRDSLTAFQFTGIDYNMRDCMFRAAGIGPVSVELTEIYKDNPSVYYLSKSRGWAKINEEETEEGDLRIRLWFDIPQDGNMPDDVFPISIMDGHMSVSDRSRFMYGLEVAVKSGAGIFTDINREEYTRSVRTGSYGTVYVKIEPMPRTPKRDDGKSVIHEPPKHEQKRRHVGGESGNVRTFPSMDVDNNDSESD